MNITEEMRVATQWGSHMPALLACVAASSGPVLELGVGHFSTPQLHALCAVMGRQLVSVESDPEWRNEMASKYASDSHTFLEDIPNRKLNVRWGASFIDHSPGGANRASAFEKLIDASSFVVMHDAQKDAENFQAVESMLKDLNWHLCTGYFPHTLIASERMPIPAVLLKM